MAPSSTKDFLSHVLTRAIKLTLRFWPTCMRCRIGPAQASSTNYQVFAYTVLTIQTAPGSCVTLLTALAFVWHAAVRVLGSWL